MNKFVNEGLIMSGMQLFRGTESAMGEILASEAGFPSKVMVATSEELS